MLLLRFKGPAFSGTFRQSDGRLVAGGDESGMVGGGRGLRHAPRGILTHNMGKVG